LEEVTVAVGQHKLVEHAQRQFVAKDVNIDLLSGQQLLTITDHQFDHIV